MTSQNPGAVQKLRLDKWLWQARFFKSRTLAATMIETGAFRVNGDKVFKPSHMVGVGDVMTLAQGGHVHLLRIVALGTRRGPAAEAQSLYQNITDCPLE